MYAIIVSGGKQHRVTIGEVINLEKLEVDVGMPVEFDKVLMLAEDGNVRVGNPYLSNAKVVGQVVAHEKGEKVHILKFRRRKHHLKRQGHRQNYTAVKINGIVTSDDTSTDNAVNAAA